MTITAEHCAILANYTEHLNMSLHEVMALEGKEAPRDVSNAYDGWRLHEIDEDGYTYATCEGDEYAKHLNIGKGGWDMTKMQWLCFKWHLIGRPVPLNRGYPWLQPNPHLHKAGPVSLKGMGVMAGWKP